MKGLEPGSMFPVGETVNRFQVTDGSANVAECSFKIVVIDNEAPSIQCPLSRQLGTSDGQCSRVVVYEDPRVSDNCGSVSLTQTTVRTSGSPSI